MFAKMIAAALLVFALPAGAQNIQANSYAWGENIGWVNFAPPAGSGGVTVSDTAVTGFAWSENFGWINFGPMGSGGVANNGAGVLSGFAWAENGGWINFGPMAAGGVTINPANGVFSGFAWGENVGWINFGPMATGGVVTTWRPNVAPGSTGVASRKLHGAAGNFDLPLALTPLNPTTEPRQGPAHTIVFTFDKPVVSGSAAITEGVATAGAPTFNGAEMTVPLSAVNNAQYVTITVSNVVAMDGSTGGAGSIRVGFLRGDVNQSRVVSVADLGLVNSVLTQPVTAANYLKDVNFSGTLTVADKGITNAVLTTSLPPP
jgi:hypothetical protein